MTDAIDLRTARQAFRLAEGDNTVTMRDYLKAARRCWRAREITHKQFNKVVREITRDLGESAPVEPIVNGLVGTGLYLDELRRPKKRAIKAMYKLVSERYVGEHRLAKDVRPRYPEAVRDRSWPTPTPTSRRVFEALQNEQAAQAWRDFCDLWAVAHPSNAR